MSRPLEYWRIGTFGVTAGRAPEASWGPSRGLLGSGLKLPVLRQQAL